MARELQEAPRSHRLIQVGAVVLASSAAAIAFGRVFAGRATTWKLVLVALLSIGLAAAFERRSPLLAALVSAAALLWTLGIMVFPHTLWFGLPLGKTVHAIGHSLGRVGHQADVQVAPTAPLRPLFMAAVTAVWTAAFSTHALAVRSGSPLLAAAPAAALVAFAGVVLEDGPRPGYAVLFLLGVLALLFADGLRRVRQWGPVRPWSSGLADVRRRVVSSSTTRGARRVAVTVVGFALLVPGLLPGLNSKPVLHLGAGDNSAINPLVSVSASLKLRNPVPLFSVRIGQGDGVYWRWLSLDRFNGDEWTTGDIDVKDGTTYGSDANLPYTVRSLPAGTEATTVSATVTIAHAPGEWLPLPYEPFDVSAPGTTMRFDPRHTALVTDGSIDPGFAYRVDSRIVEPSYVQLDQSFDYSGRAYRRNLQLPEDLPPDIPRLARAIVRRAEAHTTIAEALAIQSYLTDPLVFSYDASVPGGDGSDALTNFLFTTHRGFCQQFASAMAVLLRSLGIPARVAVGFTSGTYDEATSSYDVTTENAHSWVEAEFPGFGWVPFEPTPTRANPVTEHIVSSRPLITGPGSTGCKPDEQFDRGACGNTGKGLGHGNGSGGPNGPIRNKDPRIGEPPQPVDRQPPIRHGAINLGHEPASKPGTPLSWRIVVGLGLAAALVGFLLLFPLLKGGVRRVRSMRAKGSRERALAAFRLFESRAGDVGLGRGPGETPLEYRSRIAGEVQLSDGHLDRLATIATSAAYSPRGIGDDDATGAGRDGRVAIRDVRRSVGVARRFTGLWRPRI
jgi:transglutaminase-like putative cysteine protease